MIYYVKYNRVLSEDGRYWNRPNVVYFENYSKDNECIAKIQSETLEGYEDYNMIEITESEYNILQRDFGITNILTKAEFLRKLTTDEKIRIVNYERYINNSTDNEEVKQYKKDLMSVLIWEFNNMIEVDLNHDLIKEFSNAITYCDLLSIERVQEILNG